MNIMLPVGAGYPCCHKNQHNEHIISPPKVLLHFISLLCLYNVQKKNMLPATRFPCAI